MDKGKDSRGLYRSIYNSIWDDPDFRSLSPEAKLVFLNIRTSPLSNMPGIFSFYIEAIEKHTGLPRKIIEEALETLCNAQWIAIQDGMVWVRNALRYDPNISLNNEKQRKAIQKILRGLPKSQLVVDFCRYYGIEIPYDIPNREGIAYPMPFPDPEPEPEPEPNPEPEPDRLFSEPCQPLVDLFNKSCPNLPRVRELNQSRKDKIKARFKEHTDLSWWGEVFKMANYVSIPKKEGGEWRPTFDWLIENDRNSVKVIEGNYDNKPKGLFKPQPGIAAFLQKGKEEISEA